ncbi:MAG TPA: S8 family serine peptidase, partial [Candidatus Limnocylindrales bacterium]
MRRPVACLALVAVLVMSTVGPAAADETPPPTGSTAAPSAEPIATPTPDPSEPAATPTPDPSAVPDATPTPADPTADPTPDPTADPTTEPTPEPEPSTVATPDAAAGDDARPVDLPDGAPDPTGRYLVMLRAGADTSAVLDRHGKREGTKAHRSFSRAIRGFSATLDKAQRQALLADPTVAAVVPDEVIALASQTVPNGIRRVGGMTSTAAAINGLDARVDADVAVIDTGISTHPDLNIAGGYNCASSDRTLWRDKNGHGTHVAGTVAAIDNDTGVVGVAPGARLWAVRILNDEGYGLLSWYVCGLDWVLAQRDPADSARPLFESVNMSVAKKGADDGACGTANKDVLHAAICRVVRGGITVVAAAANEKDSATHYVPAAYNEVITVSALADTDGKPGGLGGNRCYSWGGYDKDDTFADFSNYGHDVDLIAPGKCIWSTYKGNTYAYLSGTSMAAPTVAGAVALYKASRPYATPAEVKASLQYLGNLNWFVNTDPDTRHEKLLDVSKIAKLGSFGFASHAPAPGTGESGGTVGVPVTITRTSSFFERVSLSVIDKPAGWSASFSPTSLMGWTAKTATLNVTVPKSTPKGTYAIRVAGSNWGRTDDAVIPVVIGNDVPIAKAPSVAPLTGQTVGVSDAVPVSLTMQVTWPAATDVSSPIVEYELQRSVNGGSTWGGSITTTASARSAKVPSLSLSGAHRFRLRAKDAAGNWSAWKESVDDQTFRVYSDRNAAIDYDGTWKRATVSSATNRVRTSST